MRQDLTEIVMVLDESGSMAGQTEETRNSVNRFIKEQKAVPGEANLTLVFFDERYRVIHDRKPLKDVQDIKDEYKPTGMTALIDAVGKTINSIGEKLANTPEAERPGKVVFVVLTDGEENASKEITLTRLREMIKEQETKYSWEFVFMAQNIDAFSGGATLGFAQTKTMQMAKGAKGTNHAYAVASAAIAGYRSSGLMMNIADQSQDKDE